MYYIGIKQKSFNPKNLLSENSAHWLTYFNPDSKLKFQAANHWNSAGVKEYADAPSALSVVERLREHGYNGCFVALIEKGGTSIVKE